LTVGSHKKAQAGSPSDDGAPLCAKPLLPAEIAIANKVSAQDQALPVDFTIVPPSENLTQIM